MTTVVFTWELGANYGHLSRQMGPALELRRHGHNVVFVVCDTLIASRLLSPLDLPFLQAPMVPRSVQRTRQPTLNYSSLLALYGYTEPGVLRALLEAWRHLLRQIAPDAIVVDHSPTALLAARANGFPAVQLGGGFFVPPPTDPLPCIQPWSPAPAAQLAAIDRDVLHAINATLRSLGSAELERLGTLFTESVALLTTFPELDHYGARHNVTYIGPLTVTSHYPAVTWGQRRERRVFVYARPTMPGFGELLNVLEAHSGHVICVIPGAPDALRTRLSRRGIEVHAEPVDMGGALAGCNVVVTYGGSATVAQALLAGVPVLIVPQDIEQGLVARRVTSLGAGITVARPDRQGLRSALDRLLTQQSFAAAAASFAARHASFDNAAATTQVASIIAAAARRDVPSVLS